MVSFWLMSWKRRLQWCPLAHTVLLLPLFLHANMMPEVAVISGTWQLRMDSGECRSLVSVALRALDCLPGTSSHMRKNKLIFLSHCLVVLSVTWQLNAAPRGQNCASHFPLLQIQALHSTCGKGGCAWHPRAN